jgi:hypothetical protein
MSSLPRLDVHPSVGRLQELAEPGPSTPPKHTVAHTENWDDDFEDKANSPARRPPSRPHHRSPRLPEISEKGRLHGANLGERSHDSGLPATPGASPPSSLRHPRRPKLMQVPRATPRMARDQYLVLHPTLV